MSYTPVSVPKTPNAGLTKPKVHVYIGRLKDVASFPEPGVDGVTISSALTMSGSTGVMEIQCTPSTIKITQPTEGDPDNKGVKPRIEFSRPGNQDAAFESFLENNVNEDLFVIIEYQNGTKKIAGYPGNPMLLASESNDDNEQDTNMVSLEAALRGRRMCLYTGDVPAVLAAEGSASGSASASGSTSTSGGA